MAKIKKTANIKGKIVEQMEFLYGAYGRINYFNHSGKPLGLSTKSDHVPTLRPSNSIPSFKRP